jgi:hypothetical protein
MKTILILWFIAIASSLFAQKEKKNKETGGLTAYYFWEEDSLGFIVKNDIEKPFLQNYLVRFDNQSGLIDASELKEKALRNAIAEFPHENGRSKKRRIKLDSLSYLKIPIQKIRSTAPTGMILSKKGSEWSSRIRKNVLYFIVQSDGRIQFSHATDSLVVSSLGYHKKTDLHFEVYSFKTADNSIFRQEVYNYSGDDITLKLLLEKEQKSERYLIFVNGYRGPKKDRDKTDNLVTTFDRYHYWYKLDDSIKYRFNPKKTYYLDGSMGVNTSTHRSKLGFGISYLKASIFRNSTKSDRILNTRENSVGFETRKNEGKIAGRTFLQTRCKFPNCEELKDTIDLVCHSMGYAYMLGFMEEIKDKVVFGKIYILAPESGCVDGFDWQKCQEVWQYGTHDDHVPVSELDMVAPQCMVKGLDTIPVERGGRVYIPSEQIEEFQNREKYDIIDIHDTKYFDWIINQITVGCPGYIIN